MVKEQAWGFQCLRCDRWLPLNIALPLEEGSLICWHCREAEDAHDLLRCGECGRMLASEAFGPSRFALPIKCEGCRSQRIKRATRESRPCHQCGETFTPSRTDARYCSGRCRVAAHRASRAEVRAGVSGP